MTVFAVLDASVPEQRALWLQEWRDWPAREVWAHPSYVELFANPGESVVCFTATSQAGGILYPLIVRPLALQPWAEPGELRCDAVSAYGYSAAFTWGDGESAMDDFAAGVEGWSHEHSLVSSFVRLQVVGGPLAYPREGVTQLAENVVRSLELDDDKLWYDYAHKVRKNVNRARSTGLTVEVDLEGKRLNEFLAIYYTTMDRNDASEGYYFSSAFFETLLRECPDHVVFFHVLADGEVVSTELVLASRDHLYSFLGGTLEAFFPSRANDLLKHEVIRWGRDTGRKAFVLGGGYTRDDGIFKYKMSFAPKGAVPFYAARLVHDPVAYDELMRRRAQWEAGEGRSWIPNPDYFPAYRG